ncbi:Putative hydroxypyruvate isomerase [Heterocephalus glaber]|uniref:Putative hydroxypyruvate isomerase n=1 Tax=Heterocephalus glaber TaxID=10181 RepID=G5AQF7_HETGA|nr:Putative hydroxypyruvate isomerase [Heterocephalus glaber]
MAPLRFSANLSWLFPELPGLPERLRAAGSSGFEAAEVAWPFRADPMLGAHTDQGRTNETVSDPPATGKLLEQDCRGGVALALSQEKTATGGCLSGVEWASARMLGAEAGIHLMAGRVPQGADPAAVRSEMETVFLENLRHAAEVLAQENLVGLLEPINTRITDPRYFLDTPQQAAAILQKVGRPNLQLQMDIFHWQIMDGNLTGNIREFLPIVGHVQIAQVPGRGEPGSPGELCFPYLFQLLEDEGYQGFVGCEYRPQGDTVEGLSWLHSYWDRRGRPRAGE